MAPVVTEAYSGERVEPGFTPGGLVQQHVAAYRFFTPYVGSKDVLEVGCGEGYGSAMLGEAARRVTAIDYSAEAVAHARRRGSSENLRFVAMDAERLCFAPGSFEVVCTSQVIEHLTDQRGFLESVGRLLRPGGQALVVTPNRRTSLFNPFHLHEFDPGELGDLLGSVFGEVRLMGVFGNEKALEAMHERRRWAKRLVALDVLRLRERLPRRLVVWGYGTAARALYRLHRRRGSGVEDLVSPDDYRTGTERLEECLDLFAVCSAPA